MRTWLSMLRSRPPTGGPATSPTTTPGASCLISTAAHEFAAHAARLKGVWGLQPIRDLGADPSRFASAARCATRGCRRIWTNKAADPRAAPPVSGAGRRDLCGAGTGDLSGLRRRGRSDRRGVAVSGRPSPGAPEGAPLRPRGRPLLAVSAAYPGPPRPADLRRVGGGPRTARPRCGRAGRRVAHARRHAAGQGRRPAADPVRPARHAGGPRKSAASCGYATRGRPTRRCASRSAADVHGCGASRRRRAAGDGAFGAS